MHCLNGLHGLQALNNLHDGCRGRVLVVGRRLLLDYKRAGRRRALELLLHHDRVGGGSVVLLSMALGGVGHDWCRDLRHGRACLKAACGTVLVAAAWDGTRAAMGPCVCVTVTVTGLCMDAGTSNICMHVYL